MAGYIKGITIEIDGETKGLNAALKKINTTTRSLQGELKRVNSLLKLNPGNEDVKGYLTNTHKEVYDNDQKAHDIATEAIGDLIRTTEAVRGIPGNMGPETKVLADTISRDLIQKGRADLRGRVVRNTEELAEVAQVFRDPRFETSRIIYMKDDIVVATGGASAEMPSFSPFKKKRGV